MLFHSSVKTIQNHLEKYTGAYTTVAVQKKKRIFYHLFHRWCHDLISAVNRWNNRLGVHIPPPVICGPVIGLRPKRLYTGLHCTVSSSSSWVTALMSSMCAACLRTGCNIALPCPRSAPAATSDVAFDEYILPLCGALLHSAGFGLV